MRLYGWEKVWYSYIQEYAHRNSLNAHCYWMLRKQGESPQKATKAMEGKSNAEKNELLFSGNINYNQLPSWQKRGLGLYYKTYEKTGYDPIRQENVACARSQIWTDMELELGEKYREWVIGLLERQEP